MFSYPLLNKDTTQLLATFFVKNISETVVLESLDRYVEDIFALATDFFHVLSSLDPNNLFHLRLAVRILSSIMKDYKNEEY